MPTLLICFTVNRYRQEIFYNSRRYKKATDEELTELRLAHSEGRRLDEVLCEADGRVYRDSELPVDDETAMRVGPDSLPGKTWAPLWNSKLAKRKLWSAIETAIADKLRSSPPQFTVVLDTQDGARLQFGSFEPLPFGDSRYGEGDLKAIMWAAFLSAHLPTTGWLGPRTRPVGAIATNDWDLPLTTVLTDPTFNGSEVDILLGKGFVRSDMLGDRLCCPYNAEMVALTAASGRRRFGTLAVQSVEVLPLRQIQDQPFLESYSHRLTYVFLLLCAAGVDYCDGLQKFGYTLKQLLALVNRFKRRQLQPLLSSVFSESEPLTKAFELDVNGFLAALGPPGKRGASPMNTTVAEFTGEIHAILFTVSYFAGFCARLDRGGPLIPDFTVPIFGEDLGGSLFDLLRSGPVFLPFLVVEEHPYTDPEQLLLPPTMVYGAKQAAAIACVSK